MALDAGEAGTLTAVDVASGHPVTVLDVATALSTGSGLEPVVTGARLGDVRHVVASPKRAREVLRFTATVTPEQGLAAFGSAPLRGGTRPRPAEDRPAATGPSRHPRPGGLTAHCPSRALRGFHRGHD